MSSALEARREEEERDETAALAALGMLTAAEEAQVPAASVVPMAEALSLAAEASLPVAPTPAVRSRLMSRVAAWESLKPLADVRPYDGGWVQSGSPGVDVRTLFRDPQTRRTTMLIRMQPGGRLPAHHHGDDEQCYVLKGDIRWGDVVYEEGDFVVMGKDTTHPEIHSAGGNLLLLIAGRNEFFSAG